MGKFGGLLFGVMVVGSLVSGCLGDAPRGPAQGDLNGPCLANNTCKTGLTCTATDTASRCLATVDASVAEAAPTADAGTTDVAETEPRKCDFRTTPFPCNDAGSLITCYGATQTCATADCTGQDYQWKCFSTNRCAASCCVSANRATLFPKSGCTEGSLALKPLDAGVITVSTCGQAAACPAGDTQLCQANNHCPSGQICRPVRVYEGNALVNALVVGACSPE